MTAGVETLVEAGYGPENAFFVFLQARESIVELLDDSGSTGMRHSISITE